MYDNAIILIVCVVFFYLWLKPFYRSNELIKSWAYRNNLILRRKELRFIRVGPFFYHKNRAVYRVHLENNDGDSKKAWVMVGDVFLLDSGKIRVVWDPSIKEKPNRIKDIIYFFIAIFYMILISLMVLLFIMVVTNLELGIGDYFKEAAKKWD